ncbi:hypothetical protein, partial [Klebsiella quasipneumoniae]|uniref:hypothetical protein n=1 Tax=Klebsiella quasipneumoniae TaxID=1463165 RepID=UPI0019678AEC
FTVAGISKEPGNADGTSVRGNKHLQAKDGRLKGSKILTWEGTSDSVTVELKQGEDIKASQKTRYTTATFYNVTAGTYD